VETKHRFNNAPMGRIQAITPSERPMQLIENIKTIVLAKNVVMALIVMAMTVIMAMTLCQSHTSPNNNTRIS
jgi:hypothetical protein